MKTFLKPAILITSVILTLAACGNSTAQNKKTAAAAEKSVKELSAKEFKVKVYDIKADDMKYLGDKPAIVDFTATWCGPCQRIAPILEELAAEYGDDIVIYKVDIDKERELAQAFGISSIPAILYIPTGSKEPVMTVGSRNKDKFKEEIKTHLLDK